jgi:hypothetical protein
MACMYREVNTANDEGASGASGGWGSRVMTHGNTTITIHIGLQYHENQN